MGAVLDSVRANAEPHLNAWAAKLLGNPAKVRCVVERLEPDTGEVLESKEVRLDELSLAPLDFIYAVEGGQGGQQAEIEQRIMYAIMRRQDGFPPGSLLRINPGRKPGWKPTSWVTASSANCCGRCASLIGTVRGIDADDLNLPERSVDFGVDVVELEQRAAGAEQSLRRLQNDFQAQTRTARHGGSGRAAGGDPACRRFRRGRRCTAFGRRRYPGRPPDAAHPGRLNPKRVGAARRTTRRSLTV